MADDELSESALNEKSEEDLNDQLLQDLHSNIDAIFAGGETGLDVHQQIFALGCRLLKSSTPSVDLFIAGALRTPGASLAEANSAAKRARDTVSAVVHRIGGETAHSTAAVGLIGAYITVQQLAAFTGDPYLTVLATALGQLRFGQQHPWLIAPKASVKPKPFASQVLVLRAIPFAVIEYLKGSGLYATKSKATEDVLLRLDISEEALARWRKQQRDLRLAEFEIALRSIAYVAAGVKKARKRGGSNGADVRAYDEHYGLPRIDWVADRLKEFDAHHKGQK